MAKTKKNLKRREKKAGHLMLFGHDVVHQPNIKFLYVKGDDSFIIGGTTHCFKHLDTFDQWRTRDRYGLDGDKTMAQIYDSYQINYPMSAVEIDQLSPYIFYFVNYILRDVMNLELADFNPPRTEWFQPGGGGVSFVPPQYVINKNDVRIIYSDYGIIDEQYRFRLISMYRIFEDYDALGKPVLDVHRNPVYAPQYIIPRHISYVEYFPPAYAPYVAALAAAAARARARAPGRRRGGGNRKSKKSKKTRKSRKTRRK